MPDESEHRQLFQKCIDAHADSLYRVAFRLTGDGERAEELVQETCFQAWKDISTLNDSTKARPWMFSILRNQFLKSLRVRSRTPSTVFAEEVIAGDDAIGQVDRRDLVQTALHRLAEQQRMPLLLVTMEGMSVDEAAAVLDIPRGTVLSRLHRGRQQLKRFLETELNINQDDQSPRGSI